ncbi:hypothetical protein JK359_35975 [Streptomyces actinomycinicus]|uniref:Uncharacterized protein n=1 Tax=Streptomyces actinomycinicus TaxID=1695166 RepID=A0A937EQK0_9ACTN|nr:hypothetical protein [Streptomyces actinomycinicus]MBL1087291.1 hypothetical protein [Streptomyces actinomycinicus]
MSHAIAYPVLETRDLTEALDGARRLLRIADLEQAEIWAYARLTTADEVRRMREAIPAAWYARQFDAAQVAGEETCFVEGPDLPIDTAGLAGLLPLEAAVEEMPLRDIPEGFEETFLSAMGAGPGSLAWWWTTWPAVPALGLPPDAKHGEVQIAVNSADLYRQVPADSHTLFVHVRSSQPERAEWLAAQAGLQIIGPGIWDG